MASSWARFPAPRGSSLLNVQSSGPRFGTSGSVSFHSSTRPTAFLHDPYHGFPPRMWQQNTSPMFNPENQGFGQYCYNATGQNSYQIYQGDMMVCPDGKITPRHYDYAVASSQNTPSPLKGGDSCNKSHGNIFIVSPIKNLEICSEISQETPILMEIVGILNSQVTELKTIKRKSFTIKDSHGHSVTCHYFETDRPLCKMCRGKSYRTVGRYNHKKQFFHAISVREATPEDVRLYRRLVAVGNTAIKDLKKHNISQA